MNNKIRTGTLLLVVACAIAVQARPPEIQTYAQRRVGIATITMPQRTRTYQIRKGDRLWFIAAYFYGDGHQWRKIAEANGITDPRQIYIGQVIIIPE